MPLLIEDYGLIGDTQTAALVGRNGSIDWLCLPSFESGACFAALLGGPEHGHWQIAPAVPVRNTTRRYLPDTLVLETTFETDAGAVRVIDCMPPRQVEPDIVRVVEGVSGNVPMRMELVIRFDYGDIVPWVRSIDGTVRAIAGPDALTLRSAVATRGEDLKTVADFVARPGDRLPFLLVWHPSHQSAPKKPADLLEALDDTVEWWRDWTRNCTYEGPWRDAVLRSLITLKALTFAPTGGIVAAPTMSLPERIGGVRNWDYRYCWLRDATFTLYSLLVGGFTEEAAQWRAWLLRAAAGDASRLRIMYGPSGERRLPESEIDWLPGYEGSRPVRLGNAAAKQMQLDVYGEVMDAMHLARRLGLEPDPDAWSLQRTLVAFLEQVWHKPDHGIWEVRGPRRHFTHSKVMAWVAFDRAIRGVEQFDLDGNVERWRKVRDRIHDEVCRHGFDPALNSFVQYYGSDRVDASLLMIPIVGFLPPGDPRVKGTVQAVERRLHVDGLVRRYEAEQGSHEIDGLPPGEGAFLACTFWLADDYALSGRFDEAKELFEHMLSLRNDLGLLSEEYDPVAGRMLGNFPQAFSHVALINSARNLARAHGPAEDRRATDRASRIAQSGGPRSGDSFRRD
jgi:GH15 family glucan-1,4-alpha-glucosidase